MKKPNIFIQKTKQLYKFIKKIIRAIVKLITRSTYTVLTIGYILGFITVYHLQDKVKEYNNLALSYTQKATTSYQSYSAIKHIDKILRDQLSARYKQTERNIVNSVKNINERKLAKELILGKKIEDTSLIKGIKSEVKKGFKINASKELKKITAKQKSHPLLIKALEILSSDKLIYMVLLLLSFPAFSPIVIATAIVVLTNKDYVRPILNPNENNYITMIPSMYLTNLFLAIISVVVFYFNKDISLGIAGFAHLLFIWKLFNGILLRKTGKCLSCGSELD
ncbi:MAG: hypothetical protein GY793_09595 [Proteobacteria bacterium]|nr:hypothetical protein [Pseudomonadota bacterium]